MYYGYEEFARQVATPLAWLYGAACVANVVATARAVRHRPAKAVAWAAFSGLFALLAVAAVRVHPVGLPEWFKAACDAALGPVSVFLGSFVILVVLFAGRRFFCRPPVAWTGLNLALLWFGLSLADADFAQVVGSPDNLPIVAMVFLLGYFTWLGARQAIENDDRIGGGKRPREADFSDTVLTWPDLVYIELICMLLLGALLIAWALLVPAPLEAPANPAVTPNPAKAPWYFLGLQELLVFFDASVAGVIIPGLIIVGLMAIPYLDVNPRGSGYYTIGQRPFAYLVFQFGFLQLWILLILIGTFFRGPNWSFFGFYETRDMHKLVAIDNIRLSEYFWAIWLGLPVPGADASGNGLAKLGVVLWREMPGLIVLGAYFVVLPMVLARTLLRGLRERLGRTRYVILIVLFLMMAAVPVKMLLRWTANVSYIVAMPEYSFNF